MSLRENFNVKTNSGKSYKAVDVGDVALIRNEGTQRCFWKLAKVTELKDKIVRAVWLEGAGDKKPMKLWRPVQLLTPLEISLGD